MTQSTVKTRRQFLSTAGALSVAASAVALPLSSRAQVSGNPLKILIGWPAGGLTDTVARVLAEKLGAELKRTVIVENRAGAGGQIGTTLFKALPPDGETVQLASINEVMMVPITYKKVAYNVERDLLPVSHVAEFPFVIATSAQGPATLAQYVEWAKRNPNEMSIGLAGNATPSYFQAILLGNQIGVKPNLVPYLGGAPLLTALAGGQISAAMNAFGPDMIEMHRSGRTRVIGITGDQRSTHPQFTGVPTFTEAGLPTIPSGWFGLFLPAGAKPSAVQTWQQALHVVLASDEIRTRFADFGLVPRATNSQSLTETMRRDTAVWTDIVKRTGFELIG